MAIGARLEEAEDIAPAIDERMRRHQARPEKAEKAWSVCRRTYYAGQLDEVAFAADKEHYKREIAMLRDELERMRQATEERARQAGAHDGPLAYAARWAEIGEVMTDDERRQIVWSLVKDVTISRTDQVTVTGTLGGLEGSKNLMLVAEQGFEPRP